MKKNVVAPGYPAAWRLALAADDESIVKMSLGLYEEDPGQRPVPAEHTRRTLIELRNNSVRGCAVVLDLAHRVSGYALLMSFWSNEMGGEVCYIDELFVIPEKRGQGHGRNLVQTLLNPNKIWPGHPVAIELEVTPANIRARELYTALGFRPVKNSHMRILLGI